MVLNQETFHQVLATATGFSNGFMYGIQLGWTAPTLLKLKDAEDFAATIEKLSWIASSHEIGRFFGPLLVAMLVDRIGRKYSLTMCSFSYFISWTIMVFARSITLICCLRMLQGATQGVNLVTNSIYVAENCTPKMRGILSSSVLVYVNVAVIIECALTTYTSFATAATINAAVGLCGLLSIIFLIETPYYLVMKGCNDKARKNLMWLRGKSVYDSEVESELEKIDENIQLEKLKKKSAVSVLAVPENCKSLSIMIIFGLLIIMSGYFAITAYSSMILQSSSLFSPNEYTIILAILPLVISIILPFIIERYNRRSLLLCLSFSLVVRHVCTLFLILAKIHISEEYFSWLIFLTISIFLTASKIILIIASIISSEFLPMSVKAIGNCLGALISSIAATITVAMFLPIERAYGMEFNFLLYSVVSVLLFVFILIFLPETRGKFLFDVQKSFQAKRDETKGTTGYGKSNIPLLVQAKSQQTA